jgi:hypothetical protein
VVRDEGAKPQPQPKGGSMTIEEELMIERKVLIIGLIIIAMFFLYAAFGIHYRLWC